MYLLLALRCFLLNLTLSEIETENLKRSCNVNGRRVPLMVLNSACLHLLTSTKWYFSLLRDIGVIFVCSLAMVVKLSYTGISNYVSTHKTQ